LQIELQKELPNVAIRNVFAEPALLDAYAKLQNSDPYYLTVYDKDVIVAYMPIYIRTRLWGKEIQQPLYNYYTALTFLFPNKKRIQENISKQQQINAEIASFLDKQFKRIQIQFTPAITDLREYQWQGYKVTPLYTYVQDLRTYTIDQLSEGPRREYKKAIQAETICRSDFNPDLMFNIFRLTMERQEHTLNLSRDKHIALWKSLNDTGILLPVIAYQNEQAVAFNLNILDPIQRTIYGWQSGSTDIGRKNGAQVFTYDWIYQQFATDYDYYDFCGGNIKSVARFKASLGAELQLFYRISKGFRT